MSTMPPPPGGDRSGYQPAPQYQAGPSHGTPAMTGPPPSIVTAKYAMWAGAVMQLLSIPVELLMRDQTREIVEESLRDSGVAYDASTVDTAVAVGLGVGVVLSVLGAALWVLMAFLTGRGKGWARIVATVLYGLFVVSFLFSFVQPNPPIALVLNAVVLIIGGVATFFLWRPDSTAWFRAHKAPTV
ncbi:hypothetical protein [Janibacter sp. GS2]|uniref:hypothetical protein n=1 Tax=Janibacter sp. GS2 TaxID=3442646 RepID=UPI003EBDDA27